MPGDSPSGPTTQPPITVHQGPSWLAHLLVTPPGWLVSAAEGVVVLVLLGVLYRLWESDWEVPVETQFVMGRIAGTGIGVATASLASMNLLTLPYVGDVVVGFCVGYGAVTVVLSAWMRERVRDYVPDERERLRVGWLVLAGAAIVMPMLARVNGRGMGLVATRSTIVIVAVGMVALSYREDSPCRVDGEADAE